MGKTGRIYTFLILLVDIDHGDEERDRRPVAPRTEVESLSSSENPPRQISFS